MSSDEIENLLRRRLRADRGLPPTGPGFEERVRVSLEPRPKHASGFWRAAGALASLAAVAAISAVGLLAFLHAPRTPPAVGLTPGTSPGPVTASPTAGAAPLAHADKWYLSFDYPAAWKLTDQDVLDPYHLPWWAAGPNLKNGVQTPINVSLGFVGTGIASEACSDIIVCTTSWQLPAGSVAIRFRVVARNWYVTDQLEAWEYLWNGESAMAGVSVPGYTPTTIDGVPALFASTTSDTYTKATPRQDQMESPETIPGADEILTWVTSPPQRVDYTYEITAAIRGPNQADAESQVRAMVASLRWSPEPSPIPADPAAQQAAAKDAVTNAFRLIRGTDLGKTLTFLSPSYFDCFPSEPGASVKGTTRGSPVGPLTRALPVTCVTEIAPNAMKGWTLSLTQSWEAGKGYSAGSCTMTLYLNTDGTLAGEDLRLNDWVTRKNSYPFRADHDTVI